MDARLLRLGIASIWLLTGLLIFHPSYRAIGGSYLDGLRLPHALMAVTCGFEVLLGLRVLWGPMTRALGALQLAMLTVFTVVLATSEPMLLVHPFGILTKNVPLAAAIVVLTIVDRDGWTRRADLILRAGLAAIWMTEGLLPKILFQQAMERDVVARSGLVTIDAAVFLVGLGLLEIVAGVLTLTLRGGPLRTLLAAEAAALVVLPVLVSLHEPLLWVHPFGPLTKNLPILAATIVAWRREPPRVIAQGRAAFLP